MAGFRTCGVLPFNRSAVNLSPSFSKDAGIGHTSGVPSAGSGDQTEPPPPTEDDADLCSKQEELYQKRFEEGYNLFTDRGYVPWLKENHPEVLPADQDCDLLGQQGMSGISVAFHYLSIAPQTPVVLPETAADEQS